MLLDSLNLKRQLTWTVERWDINPVTTNEHFDQRRKHINNFDLRTLYGTVKIYSSMMSNNVLDPLQYSLFNDGK
jgi:hypothetical protein